MPKKNKGPVVVIATAEQEQQVQAGVALSVRKEQLFDMQEAIDRLEAANATLEEDMQVQEESQGKVFAFLQVITLPE
jgi:uncharacterized protein (UPF0335 family)